MSSHHFMFDKGKVICTHTTVRVFLFRATVYRKTWNIFLSVQFRKSRDITFPAYKSGWFMDNVFE